MPARSQALLRMNQFLDGSLNPMNVIDCVKHNAQFRRDHPDYFDPCGLLIFCGPQGSGKTLSAVQYVLKILEAYPKCILVTNVHIKDLPPEIDVRVYKGIRSLTSIHNGYHGVIFLIDEIQLEFNSLESSNIPIEVFIEISQQRKQRVHIVGTSQVYMRLAKPFREQMKNVVLCTNFLKFLQINTLIDGEKTVEENNKLVTESVKRFVWFHSPALYDCYDTYQKMERYNKEWKGVRRSNVV